MDTQTVTVGLLVISILVLGFMSAAIVRGVAMWRYMQGRVGERLLEALLAALTGFSIAQILIVFNIVSSLVVQFPGDEQVHLLLRLFEEVIILIGVILAWRGVRSIR